MMDEEEKRDAFTNWEKRWKEFLDDILTSC
jgi:hypothetical protein